MPDGLFRADKNNFGPRLGVAFQISKKTVLRGACNGAVLLDDAAVADPAVVQEQRAVEFAIHHGCLREEREFQLSARQQARGRRYHPDHGQSIPRASWRSPTVRRSPRSGTPGIGRMAVLRAGMPPLEHQFPYATAVRLSYIGSHGSDLEQQFELNTREAEYNYVARTGLAPPNNRIPAVLEQGLDFHRDRPQWVFLIPTRARWKWSAGSPAAWRSSGSNTFTRSRTTTDSGGFDSGNTGINRVAGRACACRRICRSRARPI